MAIARTTPIPAANLRLSLLASSPETRVLAWHKNSLYASCAYRLIRADVDDRNAVVWSPVARYRPPWIRRWSTNSRLAYRLLRDGFHALAVLSSGHMVAAVPRAIVSLEPGSPEFRMTFEIRRGTRPLHIASTPDDRLYWGEYFDNRERREVHIYGSTDRGAHWDVAHTFPARSIRHVHNIVYDRWQDCLWILTGDEGSECRILRASRDLRDVEVVLTGHQQVRAVAIVPTEDAVYFASDTPLEKNYIYRLRRSGDIAQVAEISGSSIYGCAVGPCVFFSTMVEPSTVNLDRHSRVFGSADTNRWSDLLAWKKDKHSPRLFQYGNIFFPDGENSRELLALSAIAVENHDLETSIWRVEPDTSF